MVPAGIRTAIALVVPENIGLLRLPALVAFGHVGGVDLKVGAGQVVEQLVELDIEQIAPAGHQMAEQICFVDQQKS
jgi:hypothetical protein